MGLIDKLKNQGTPLSLSNGKDITPNPLTTSTSKLHANGNQPGYSLDGSNASEVTAQYSSYVDGAPNILPQPSQLDIVGKKLIKYLDNLPK